MMFSTFQKKSFSPGDFFFFFFSSEGLCFSEMGEIVHSGVTLS